MTQNTWRSKPLYSAALGNVIEMYDFTLYAYLSPLLGQLFFPSSHPATSLLSTYLVFAVGFLIRPFGGLFFGKIADKWGRKRSLFLSVLLMSVPTFCIGMLPTYHTIGLWAPLLLATLRLLQGFSVGGEYVNSILYLTEHAPPSKKGWMGSFVLTSATIGWILGSYTAHLITRLFSPDTLLLYGWRLPFLIGGVLALIGCYFRSSLVETPEFQEVKETPAPSLRSVVQKEKWTLFKVIRLNTLPTIAGYLLFAYMPSYLHLHTDLSLERALLINSWMLMLFLGLTPLMGYLSDKWGKEELMKGAGVGFILLSPPLFYLIASGASETAILCALSILTLLQATYHAPLPALMSESFPTKIRGTGVSLAYNSAVSLFSGTTPLMCTFLISAMGMSFAPGIYLMCAGVLSLTGLLNSLSHFIQEKTA